MTFIRGGLPKGTENLQFNCKNAINKSLIAQRKKNYSGVNFSNCNENFQNCNGLSRGYEVERYHLDKKKLTLAFVIFNVMA